jgi:hypothetical protein
LTIEYTLQQTNIAMKNDSSIDDLPITLLHDDCHSYVQRSGVLNHNTWGNPLIWSSILDGYIWNLLMDHQEWELTHENADLTMKHPSTLGLGCFCWELMIEFVYIIGYFMGNNNCL